MEIREGSYHHWHRPGWWPGDGSARDMFMVCSLQLNAAVLQCCSNELMDVPSLASLSPLSFSPYTDTGHGTWHTCPRPLLAASSEDFVILIEHDHGLHPTACLRLWIVGVGGLESCLMMMVTMLTAWSRGVATRRGLCHYKHYTIGPGSPIAYHF